MNARAVETLPSRESSHKSRIRAAFSAAAGTYDRASEVQQEVANRLASLVLAEPPPSDAAILEIGCGTGHLTRRLLPALPDRRWLVTDLAAPMLDRCSAAIGTGALGASETVSFRVMDGEWPDVSPASFDLIVSSLAFQWFDELDGALARLAACLRPGGRLVFATLGADTFHEWHACLEGEGAASGIRRYPSVVELSRAATLLAEDRIAAPHPSGRAFLESLKAIGAQVAAPGYRPLPTGTLRRALGGFDGTVTYHVLYGELVRPPLACETVGGERSAERARR